MIHCLTSFTSSFFPYEQGNCHLMTEPLRIYLCLYGKLPLLLVAWVLHLCGIYRSLWHLPHPRLQGLELFSQPAVHIYLPPGTTQAVASGFIIYLGNDSINTWTCHLNDLTHRFFPRYFCRRIHHLTLHVGVADLLQIVTDEFRDGIQTE